jgi:uridine kinase
MSKLGESVSNKVGLISLDSFYKVLSDAERQQIVNGEFNFDHPGMDHKDKSEVPRTQKTSRSLDAFDFKALENALTKLRSGEAVDIPIYDFKARSRYVSHADSRSRLD